MTEKRRQVDQPSVRIDALTVPSQQSADGKGVPKIVQSRRGDSRRKGQTEFGHEGVKRLADCLWAYTAAFRKREQWLIRITPVAIAFLYVKPEACRQFGPERHNATLTKFRVANEQRGQMEIDISHFQPDGFANTQAK